MKAKLAVLATLSLLAVTAKAEPAPWHVWQSRLDGKTTCAQTSPGADWETNDGPFSNARCRKVQTRPSGTYDQDNSTAKHFAREPQSATARKNRMMELMAIFDSARAGR